MSTDEQYLDPATTQIHLTFNAGEDKTVRLVVRDKLGQPVPLASAVATIATPYCPPLHQWTVGNGLELPAGQTGVVLLHTTREQTTAWATAWGDSEWQLDTVDVFGRDQRPCEGDVRVNPTRRPA